MSITTLLTSIVTILASIEQVNTPLVTSVGQLSEKDDIMTSNAQSLQTSESNLMQHQLQT